MDNAVISVGESHSAFNGIKSSDIERDPAYPIRCTIQFYKVTDEKNVTKEVFEEMERNISRIYNVGEK